MRKKIAFTGGGTAGHITPNIALIENLRNDFDIIYIGSRLGLEENMMKNLGVKFYKIDAPKFTRKLNKQLFTLPLNLIKAISQAKQILKKEKPDLVFSKGGFVSVPTCIASGKLKIPIISHESDFSMGLANKIIYRYCKVMCTSFDNFSGKKKCVCTGTPIRKCVFNKPKNKLFADNKKTLLFMGGSLGANVINEFVFSNYKSLQDNYNIILITGKNKANESILSPSVKQIEFTDNIGELYNQSDIVICRAGSNTIFELKAIDKKMVLIPLPKGISRGDQIENAEYFKAHGWAQVIKQQDLNYSSLTKALNNAINQKTSTNPLENANEKIASIIKHNIK